jgi:transposase-like protein
MARPKRKASADSPGTRNDTIEIGRFSSRRKMEAILQLLRGEDLDTLSRRLGVTAATLAQWREQFLAAGQAGLKSRAPDARDDEILRLRAKIGEITMANELLLDRCHTLEAGRPLAPRRRSA